MQIHGFAGSILRIKPWIIRTLPDISSSSLKEEISNISTIAVGRIGVISSVTKRIRHHDSRIYLRASGQLTCLSVVCRRFCSRACRKRPENRSNSSHLLSGIIPVSIRVYLRTQIPSSSRRLLPAGQPVATTAATLFPRHPV